MHRHPCDAVDRDVVAPVARQLVDDLVLQVAVHRSVDRAQVDARVVAVADAGPDEDQLHASSGGVAQHRIQLVVAVPPACSPRYWSSM